MAQSAPAAQCDLSSGTKGHRGSPLQLDRLDRIAAIVLDLVEGLVRGGDQRFREESGRGTVPATPRLMVT